MTDDQLQTMHCLERTSPFGERFVGTCILCGKTGLSSADALQPCDNPAGLSREQTLRAAIDGPEKHE